MFLEFIYTINTCRLNYNNKIELKVIILKEQHIKISYLQQAEQSFASLHEAKHIQQSQT